MGIQAAYRARRDITRAIIRSAISVIRSVSIAQERKTISAHHVRATHTWLKKRERITDIASALRATIMTTARADA